MTDLIDDRYAVGDVIASGGMATVWRARDTRLDRDVALKRPHPTSEGDPLRRRFEREARLAAGLAHPNVITVYDTGEDETGPYLVMELADGPTLADTAVESDRAVEIGADLASALAAIHAAGIVHRDVKPSNVIMSSRGPLLTDFGIARGGDTTSDLTLPDQIFTTPAYAPPEVLAGGQATPASDVYSLAVVIVEAVTGQRDLDDLRAIDDAGVREVLANATSTRPQDRPDAATLATTLRLASKTAVPIVPVEPPPTEPLSWGRPTTRASDTVVMAPIPPVPIDPMGSDIPDRAVPTSMAGEQTPTGRPSGRGVRTALAAAVIVVGLILLASTLGPEDSTELASGPTDTQATTPPIAAAPTTVTIRIETTTTVRLETTTTSAAAGAGARLVEFIESIRSRDLKPKESREILDRIDSLLGDSGEGASQTVREIRARIDSIEDEGIRDEANRLLDELANLLGIRTDEEGDD